MTIYICSNDSKEVLYYIINVKMTSVQYLLYIKKMLGLPQNLFPVTALPI